MGRGQLLKFADDILFLREAKYQNIRIKRIMQYLKLVYDLRVNFHDV